MASQGAAIVIQLTSTVVLARLLGPEEYGVIAMVTAVTAFAGLFRDLGLSSSTIQRDKLSHDQLSTLYWINVGMGAGLTILLASASPLVAWFYGRPEFVAVTVAVSLNFLVGSFGTQPGALLNRQMRFGRIAAANLSGGALGMGVSISIASQGFSYWSLVVGGIAGGTVTTVMLTILCGWRPGMPVRGSGVRSMLNYGANVTAFDIVNYFHRNLDNILIGRVWGAGALGFYSRAYALLMFPINAIRGPINSVAFPAMSKLQNEPAAFRAYYRKITGVIGLLSMPLTVFLFVAADPIITVALGEKWSAVIPIFAILAVTAFLEPVSGLRGMVLLSTGQARRYFYWGMLNAVSVSVGFVIGVRWGAVGVAMSYGIVRYAILYPSLLIAFANTSLCPRDFFEPLRWPALAACAAGLTTFAAMRLPAIASRGPASLLIIATVIFGLSIFLVLYILPGTRKEVKVLIESFRATCLPKR